MKIAVLGLGFMGSTHLNALRKIPEAELAAVASDIPQRLTGDLSDVQGNIGGPGGRLDFSRVRKYSDAYQALRDFETEAVDLCLPTHLHAPVAVAALQAGKHVLVEKPMALTAEDCERMIAAARQAGRILMVAQVLRFIPAYRTTAETIRSGRLGAVRAAIFRRRCAAPAWGGWLHDKAASGGGVFDLLIHDVDFMLQAFGRPEAVSAAGCEDLARGVDWITATFYYPGGPAVVISGGWHHPKAFPFSMEFTVVGEQGTIEYSSEGRPLTLYRADGEAEALEAGGEQDWYEAEIRYFLQCAARNQPPEFCPPEESAAAVKLALRMLEARSRNGEKIPCTL